MGAKEFFDDKGFMGESTHFQKLGKVFDESFYIFLTAVGTVFMAIGGALLGNWKLSEAWASVVANWWCIVPFLLNPAVMLIGGVVLFFIGARGTHRDQSKQQDSIRKLESSLQHSKQEAKNLNELLGEASSSVNDGLEKIELLNGKLRELHADLVTNQLIAMQKLFELTTDDRITVYYELHEEFYLLARHSLNPAYTKTHRQKFPVSQGVIGFAWHRQEFVEANCPSCEEGENYFSYVVDKHQLDPSSVNALTMKSCRYLAFAISDAGKHIGVVVFESVNLGFFSMRENQLESILRKYFKENQDMFAKYVRDGLILNRDKKVKQFKKDGGAEIDLLSQFKGGIK